MQNLEIIMEIRTLDVRLNLEFSINTASSKNVPFHHHLVIHSKLQMILIYRYGIYQAPYYKYLTDSMG